MLAAARVWGFERSACFVVCALLGSLLPRAVVGVCVCGEGGAGAGCVGRCQDSFPEELILVSSVGRAFGF